MKTLNKYLGLLTIVGLISSCGNQGANSNADTGSGNNPTDTLSAYDSATVVKDAADTSTNYPATFVVKAASGGMMEVELGNLAQKNAQNPRVKSFGAMMVKDHSNANKELLVLASKKSISVPGKVSAEHQDHINEMMKLKGADFDKHYMGMMVDDHKEDVNLFETAAKNLDDPELKSFASKTLTVLNAHLDSAKAINDVVK